MKASKSIIFDVDGVIADLHVPWLARYNQDYNDCLNISNITEWDMKLFVKPECGKKIFDYLKDPSLYDNVWPIEGAFETIKRLKRFGYRIVYATCTPIETPGRKYYWLQQYGFIHNIDDYMEISDKSLIRADILIDDRPKNLFGFEGKKILYAQPWNKLDKNNPDYLYAENWNEVLNYCL